MKKMLPVFVVLLILIGGGSFYGGMKYANAKVAATPSARGGAGNFRGGAGGGTGRVGSGRGGFASGEIISSDSSSVTIKLRDGGSQIIFFSTSTQIMKASPGSTNDLKAGASVMVNGSANQDGSV